jgi:putative FmdB family regulatory protein
MPTYDYRCRDCGRAVRLFIAYADYDTAEPQCPHCQSRKLKRRLSRVSFARSEESRLDSLMADPDLAGLEEDPRALGRFMRQMSHEMGEEMDDEFNEVVDRLEKGESPDDIEASMPDLGDAL